MDGPVQNHVLSRCLAVYLLLMRFVMTLSSWPTMITFAGAGLCVLAGQGRYHSAHSCSFINTVLCFPANRHECGHSAEDPLRVKAEEVEECVCVLTG